VLPGTVTDTDPKGAQMPENALKPAFLAKNARKARLLEKLGHPHLSDTSSTSTYEYMNICSYVHMPQEFMQFVRFWSSGALKNPIRAFSGI